MPTILLAGLYHETHTFLSGRTGLSDFKAMMALEGDEILRHCRGDASPAGGFIEVADELGWKILPSIHLAGMPSGLVKDEVLDTFWKRLERDLRSGYDAIYLVLHGAMVCESFPDVEGEVLRRIQVSLRSQGRQVPVAGVLDLHGNFSDAMAEHSNLLVSYRENPHTDAKESAARAARLLARVLGTGVTPRMAHLHLPIIHPPKGTGSAGEPMKSVLAAARKLEAEHPELLAVNVMPGFAYADVPDCGFDLSCSTTAPLETARGWLREPARVAWALREKGNLTDPPIDGVLAEASKLKDGPIVIIEPSDNIGGGTPGDGTGVLAAFLRHGIRDSCVVINDPEVAAECHRRKVGDTFRVKLGAKSDRFHGETLDLEVKLKGVSDGKFDLENPHSHIASMLGLHIQMGLCATVETRGVTIVVTTLKTPPHDLGQLRSQGVIPEKMRMIGVKAAVAHKAAYDPIARHSFYADTPGLGSSNVKNFTYRHVRRPAYPLDEMTWEP